MVSHELSQYHDQAWNMMISHEIWQYISQPSSITIPWSAMNYYNIIVIHELSQYHGQPWTIKIPWSSMNYQHIMVSHELSQYHGHSQIFAVLQYLPQILYVEGVRWLGPQTWFNPPNPGLQSRAICGTMCALSIAYSIFTNRSTISLLVLFDLILKWIFCWYFIIMITWL